MTTTDVTSARPADRPRPLRKDAERNRQRILAAASAAFAAGGLKVTMDEIAEAAGIGVGTVYRRFPDKRQLIEALFEERVQREVELAEAAAQLADPWAALVYFLDQSLSFEAKDRALAELIRSGEGALEGVRQARDRISPLASALLCRAQEAGEVRLDVTPTDLVVMKLMIHTVALHSEDIHPGLWRRYLTYFLESIRARPGLDPLPLPTPAMSIDELTEAVVTMQRNAR
jgi:AcrR family transcriptional regulator